MTDHGLEWQPKVDVVDPADEYADVPPVPTNQTHEEKPVSHRLNATISDEAFAALTEARKDGETENEAVRRLLHKALKLPKPASK